VLNICKTGYIAPILFCKFIIEYLRNTKMKNKIKFLSLLLLLFSSLIIAQGIKHPAGNYAVVNGKRLWYEIEGKGEPILLIPGGPGNSHTYFHPWFSELARNFQVIYFDAYGRGKSDRAELSDQYSFKGDVEDIEGLRKALGFDKWNILGHSYGGMVAQQYALDYPNSVDKLILMSTFYSGEMWQANDNSSNYEIRNQYPEVWEKVMELRNEGEASSSAEHVKAYSVPSGLLYFYDASNAYKVSKDSLIMNNDVYYRIAGKDADFLISGDIGPLDFRAELKNLKMPVLILEGRFDRISIPRFSIKYKDYVPQAEFVMFERSGHDPFIEEPEKTFKVITEFLKK
jgi:proline iminopeptidase